MEQESTSELMNILKNSDKEDIPDYQKEHLQNGSGGFTKYIDNIIKEKKLKRKDIFQKADVPLKYGYKLLSGESHTTDRDKLLRILISMNMDIKETQRALTLYGFPVLYPKFKRDAVIIIAINKGISSVDTVNDWLEEHQEKELSRSEDK